ncbi:MAG: hypothetical protein K0R24_1742 [Gammaproteobacteria bacterium]|jgi:hypothetical protein|nr:hypothetical protein [Gammaproteobacteria bacterium]MCE3238761.1 hypothetical protein [Gammaproteobacteria bacterium]
MLSLADAIIEEQPDQVLALLRAGAPVNHLDEYGFTPLIEAAIADNIAISTLLINQGANVNLADATGGTALHWAAENNNIQLAELLFAQGANPNPYTFAGQPALVMPLLRQQNAIKKLFLKHGANLEFAQDFINAKLLGHMFELVGTANIIHPDNHFVELDFEGFFLEVSLAIITESLIQFKNHFAARDLRRYAHFTQLSIESMSRAARLIKYQQYRTNIKRHHEEIHALIQQEPLIIPIGYEGHAITFVKLDTILIKCDRREDSRLYDNIVFYRIQRPDVMTTQFISNLIYNKKSDEFINHELPRLLHLTPITELKISAQISGNCSWANVEACIPALFFLLFSEIDYSEKEIGRYKTIALKFFNQWREWNKDRALHSCIRSFHQADSIRKACKAEILAAILYQSCRENSALNAVRIQDILNVFSDTRYKPLLQNYIKSYCYEDQSEEGKHFMQLLRAHEFL